MLPVHQIAEILLVLVFSIATHHSSGQMSPYIGPFDEARYIALDATDDLLPDPNMVVDIAKAIIVTRAQNPVISNVRNNGPWFLGKLRVYNYNDEMLSQLRLSRYGPVVGVAEGDDDTTIVTFMEPYQPIRLAQRLRAESGIISDPVWKTGRDYGEIILTPESDKYTFRQGFENCGHGCQLNRFWAFEYRFERSVPLGQSLTGIPIINRVEPIDETP